eukprot:tig00022075_g23633.t1
MLGAARHFISDLKEYYKWGDPCQNQIELVELLKYAVQLFADNKLEYWIDYGTLLGLIRHGRVIPWDHDLDFAMRREDFKRLVEIARERRKDGDATFYFANPGTIQIHWKNKVFCDVEEFAEVDGRLVPTIPVEFQQGCRYPPYPLGDVFPLRTAEMSGGVRVSIPNRPEAVLAATYGHAFYRVPLVPFAFTAVYHPLQAAAAMGQTVRRFGPKCLWPFTVRVYAQDGSEALPEAPGATYDQALADELEALF